MVWKGPRNPKHTATMAVCDPVFPSLSLLLGRDPCGDRILRSCLQKGSATTPANYDRDSTLNDTGPLSMKASNLLGWVFREDESVCVCVWMCECDFLVAPYCAIPRDYLSDTPLLRTMGFLVSQHCQLGAISPPPFLSVSPWRAFAKWRCDTPPLKRGISAILARYPTKQGKRCAIPLPYYLERVLRDIGGVPRIGLLSATSGLLAKTKLDDLIIWHLSRGHPKI